MRPIAGAVVCGFVALFALTNAARAQVPVVLDGGRDTVPLAGHIAVLTDSDGTMSVTDARAAGASERFVASELATFNFGYTEIVKWYRLRVRNTAATPAAWVLEVGPGGQDYVDIHWSEPGGSAQSIYTGDRRPLAQALLPARRFAAPLTLASGESEILVRITGGVHLVNFALWSTPRFHRNTTREDQLYGMFFGLLLVMAVYNLILFAWIRDRAYLFYVLYISSMACVAAGFTGYARLHAQSLFPADGSVISNSIPQALLLVNLSMPLFARDFMRLPSVSPVLSRLCVFFGALAAVELVASAFLSYGTALQFAQFGALFGAPIIVAYAAWLASQGLREARFFVLAWFPLIGIIVPTLLAVLVLERPYTAVLEIAWLVGVALEAILLSLALADRIAQERKGRFAAIESATRLQAFLPPKVAQLVGAGQASLLEPKRRNVTVCVIDLRGFTPFSEAAAPEDVMAVLHEFYDTMGKIVGQHGGTVEHFAGDSMLIFFNAPLELAEPEKQAVECALEMRAAFAPLRDKWRTLGHELGLGIGIADGYATIGAIGFSGRSQYAAIGAVTNLAARLCSNAQHGEILTTSRVLAAVGGHFDAESAGDQQIRGFSKPVPVVRVIGTRSGPPPEPVPALASAP